MRLGRRSAVAVGLGVSGGVAGIADVGIVEPILARRPARTRRTTVARRRSFRSPEKDRWFHDAASAFRT
jgi:hypothetical protein